MTETTDGFLISEADMKLRGPGDIEGTQQSGLAFNLKVANLTKDGQILSLARKAALAVLQGSPGLLAPECHPTEPRKDDAKPISLGYQEMDMVRKELIRRFPHSVDWSKIS